MARTSLAVIALLSLVPAAGCTNDKPDAPHTIESEKPAATTSEDTLALASDLDDWYYKTGRYPRDPNAVHVLMKDAELRPLADGARVNLYFALTQQPGFVLCVVNDDTREWAYYDSTAQAVTAAGVADSGGRAEFDSLCSSASSS